MAYDPRLAALADGLYTQRFGKTVLVVTDDTARDALDPAVTPVAVTASDDLLNIYDTDASAWVKLGKDDIVTVATVADLDSIPNPEDVKLAIVGETSEIYRYDGATWVLCAGGGSGGAGIQTVATAVDLSGIANPEDNPVALVLDENVFYSYIDGSWSRVNGDTVTKEVVGGGSWSLVDKMEFDATMLAKDYILEDGHYRVSTTITTIMGADPCGFKFGTSSFHKQFLSSAGTINNSTSPEIELYPTGLGSYGGFETVFEFTIRNGVAAGFAHYTRVNNPNSGGALGGQLSFYCEAMTTNVMSLFSDVALTGRFELHRWEDIRATEYHTYELVKELHFENEIVDFTIPWDGEEDPDLHIVCTSSGALNMLINDDDGSSSYKRAFHGGGTAHYSRVDTMAYINIGPSDCPLSITDAYLKVGSGFRGIDVHAIKAPSTGDRFNYVYACAWNNVVDPVTSLRFFSNGTATSGVLKIYKLAKTHLLDTAINKVGTETDLLNTAVWDGKLAMTLDTKQLFVYDATKKAWLGKSGMQSQANVYAETLVGEYNGTEIIAGVTIDVRDTDTVIIDTYAKTLARVGNVGIRVDGDATSTYQFAQINTSGSGISATNGNISCMYAGVHDSMQRTTVTIFENAVHATLIGGYNTPESIITLTGRKATASRAQTLLLYQAVAGLAADAVVRVYKRVPVNIPDFASAEANLYGWKLRATGDITTTKTVIPVNGVERTKLVVNYGASTSKSEIMFSVNNDTTATYLNSSFAASNLISNRKDTLSAFRPLYVSEWSGYWVGRHEYELRLHNGIVSAISTNPAYPTEDSVTPAACYFTGYSGAKGVTEFTSVDIWAASAPSGATYELYEWGPIEVPIGVASSGSGSGLTAVSVSDDAMLDFSTYAMVDTSVGPVVLTMPDDPATGAELVVLDAMRTFGQAGHECSLLSPNTPIEGSTEAVDLNVEGKEYKFRFVGGTMGWRML